MDEHARAWGHEFVAGVLNTTALPPEQRNSLHWEILSHLHEKAERRVEARGGTAITLADLQAVVQEMGGPDGVGAVFLQTRVVATPRAGFGKRLGAFLIDAVLIAVGLGFLSLFMFEFFFLDAIWFFDAVFPVFYFGAAWGYLVVCEMRFGATVGKMAFKLRTVMVDGRPLTPGAAMVRNVAKVIPPLLLIDVLLYLVAFSRDDQRASDRLANTIVIDTTKTAWTPPPAPPPPP
ncbi:MAG: RDD family protein, partial [Euryarchaeota archaeon]|nr:RDD family protein [Euryarchaeota archaeon]